MKGITTASRFQATEDIFLKDKDKVRSSLPALRNPKAKVMFKKHRSTGNS